MLQEDGAVLGSPQTSRGSVEEVFNDLQGTALHLQLVLDSVPPPSDDALPP